MNSSERKNRLPRLKRAAPENRPSFQLTIRDRNIIHAVYEYRVLTAPQIDQLFFRTDATPAQQVTTSRCLYRLKLLYHHGYLERQEQLQLPSGGPKPFLYFLAQRGAKLIAETLDCTVADLDWRKRDIFGGYRFLSHLLATNDVRIAFMRSAVGPLTIGRWLDERTIRKTHTTDTIVIPTRNGHSIEGTLIPDGYFVLETSDSRYHYFLELDLRTEGGEATGNSRSDWAHKVPAYLAYQESGHFTGRYAAKAFRVLTVTTGPVRAANLKAITERAGGDIRFLFTTLDLAKQENIVRAPIWSIATREGLRPLLR